ncbi:MAG: Helix-turn-helix domain [Pseudobdellovibrio sp.]|nr:Helix-turn-helix domain [Pseudobdellovibrio sp.]
MKMARQQNGLTQSAVAAKAKLSLRQYSKIETGGTNPSIETICRLSSVFGMTADELMRVRMIRTNLSKEEYLEAFKAKFKAEPTGAGIRTLNGLVLWGNSALEALGLPRTEGEPVDLFKVLKGPAIEIIKCQLLCEQKGLATPYINYSTDKITGERTFIRYCPTLIFPESGNEPYFVANYCSLIESDSHASYYRFCDNLLSIE